MECMLSMKKGLSPTTGTDNYGVWAENTNADSNNAHGVYARNEGTGAVIAENAGQITTTTVAHGIYAQSLSTSGDVRIINSKTVATQGTQAHAILVENQGGTTGSEWDAEFATDGAEANFAVYITNSGTLTAQGTNALAMKTTDLNDRVENTGTTPGTTGTINGDVDLGAGNDVFIMGLVPNTGHYTRGDEYYLWYSRCW